VGAQRRREAGLHPSNIHDNAYCVGTLDFTGDTPIPARPDGRAWAGVVCPVTVVSGDRWKLARWRPATRCGSFRCAPTGTVAADHRHQPTGVAPLVISTSSDNDDGVLGRFTASDGNRR